MISLTLFLQLASTAISWIQRYRVRAIDDDIGVVGLILVICICVIAVIIKWFSQGAERK